MHHSDESERTAHQSLSFLEEFRAFFFSFIQESGQEPTEAFLQIYLLQYVTSLSFMIVKQKRKMTISRGKGGSLGTLQGVKAGRRKHNYFNPAQLDFPRVTFP